MFFIYLFFSIGVLATLVLMLPSILMVIAYLGSLFRTFKQEHNDKVEVRQKVLEKKKAIKLAKIKEKYGDNEEPKKEEVEEVEEVQQEEKAVCECEEVKPEIKAEPEIEVHEEVKQQQLNNFVNPYINTHHEEN